MTDSANGVHLTWEKFKAAIEKEMERGYEPPMRIVSPCQYDVLQEMLGEGKLNASFDPKPEFYDEFIRRVKAKNAR